MKILVSEPFDYELVPGQVLHVTPWPEPITVKREVGERGVALGCAKEVQPPKAKATKPAARAKPVRNEAGRLGGTDIGAARPVADSGSDDAGNGVADAGDMPNEPVA